MSPDKAAILIIDDEADMCWAVKRIFTSNGHRVTAIDTGEKALQQIRDTYFPLILLDAKLPDIEGIQLAQCIKQCHPDTYIILLTGYFYRDDPVIADALAKQLINDFIAKPFANQDVLQAVYCRTP